MKQRVVTACTLILLFSGMSVIENSALRARPPEPQSAGTSSIYALAGEFRVVFANLLWMKAENYHHEHIEHGGVWTRNKELMGLIDLITVLDPHFVEAYATGAYIYADGYRDYRRAVAFLGEGLVNNPRSWELHHLAAILYAGRLHDPKQALPYARQAVRYCHDSFYRRQTVKLLHTIEELAAEPTGSSADSGRVSGPEGPSRKQH